MNAKEAKHPIRIYQWDTLKFVLILLVVFGHFIHSYTEDAIISEKLYVFILGFHMPAFLFISGIFSKKTIQTKNYRKCFEYFVLYVFCKVCIFISKILIQENYDFSLFDESGVPWYAFALIAFVLFTILLQQVQPVYLFVFSIILGCIIGYDDAIGDLFVSSRIVVFYPFFLAGYLLDGHKLLQFLSKFYFKIIGVGIFLAWACYIQFIPNATNLWHPLVTGRETLDKYGINYFWYRALYYVVIFLLIFSAIALTPNRNSIISTWGSRSIQVYTLHRGLIYIFYHFYNADRLLAHFGNKPTMFVLFILSILLTIFLSLPFWETPLQRILKPRWKPKNNTKNG